MGRFLCASLAGAATLGSALMFTDREAVTGHSKNIDVDDDNADWVGSKVGSEDKLANPWTTWFPPKGDIERPRMLAMRGCSGSSAIMIYARDLLRFHGIPVPMPAPANTVDGKALPPVGKGWPAELLKPAINWFYEAAGNDMGAAMLMANEEIRHTHNQTLFFKGMVQELAHGDEYAVLDPAFRKLQPYVVMGSRTNQLDQVICQIKDCFQADYGHPVDDSGEESNMCFARRGAIKLGAKRTGSEEDEDDDADDAEREDLEEMQETELSFLAFNTSSVGSASMYAADDGYKAFMCREHVAKNIERELKLMRKAREHLTSSGFPFIEISEEDLLEFQTDMPGALERANKAWNMLLKGFGVEPKADLVDKYLRQYAGTYPAPPPHSKVIANMDDVIQELLGTDYFQYIRWEEGHVPKGQTSNTDTLTPLHPLESGAPPNHVKSEFR